jgi:hypothetical protein
MTKRIALKPGDLTIVEGPLYQEWREGESYTFFDYFVVYQDRKPQARTLDMSFRSMSGAEEAKGAFEDCEVINIEHWDNGDPWMGYHQGMTLEERWAPHGEAWQQEQNERNGY